MRIPSLLAVLALILGMMIETFLCGHRAGPGWLLMVGGSFVAIRLVLWRLEKRASAWVGLLWLPPLAASVAQCVYDADVLHEGAPWLCAVSLVLCAYWSFAGPVPFEVFARAFPLSLLGGLFQSLLEIVPGLRALSAPSDAKGVWRRVLLGGLVSIPMLAIFTGLFAMSDPVFDKMVTHLRDSLGDGFLGPLARIALFAALVLGLLRTLAVRGIAVPGIGGGSGGMDPVVLGVAVGMLNLLFLSFLAIQARYLFGGHAMIALPGVTHAEYARKGFFELETAVLLVFGVVALVYRLSWTQAGGGWPLALSGVLILETYGVAASAMKRMAMYAEAYGMTVERFYASTGMVCMCSLLAIVLIATVWRRPMAWVTARVMLASLLMLGGVSLLDVEGTVARVNVARILAGGKPVDLGYLGSLSADVVPALEKLRDARLPECATDGGGLDALDAIQHRLRHASHDLRSANLRRLQASGLP